MTTPKIDSKASARARLRPLLDPASIAIVGASDSPTRIGGMALRLLLTYGYGGAIYPINPKYQTAMGLKCYPSVEALEQTPDLAVLNLAATDVLQMLIRCHDKGIPSALLYASGFAEAGGEGAALQDEIAEFARRSGMAIAGPNLMGFANFKTNAYTAFSTMLLTTPKQTEGGWCSILAQSGNLCSTIYAMGREKNLAFNYFVNGGNEAAVTYSDYLDYISDDPDTVVVLSYLEQVRDGPGFIDAAAKMHAQGKMLAVYKAGDSEKGQLALKSHTSALAGDREVHRAAFRQLNIAQVDDLDTLADLGRFVRLRHKTAGRRIAVVTMSGAVGAILADKLTEYGLELPTLSEPLQEKLREGIPEYGMTFNPVDLTGKIMSDKVFFRKVAEALMTTDDVDAVLIYAPGAILEAMADDLISIAAEYPRLICALDPQRAPCGERLWANGVAVVEKFGDGVRALAAFLNWRAQHTQTSKWLALREAQASATTAALPGRNEHEVRSWLTDFGLQGVAERVAASPEEAARAGERLGYPVAVKVLSKDISHKTEAGGVKLGLNSAEEVRTAYRDIMASAARYDPGAKLEGVLVQKMERGVAELVLGVIRNQTFGWSLVVGLGGVLTELYHDVSHRVLPVDSDMAGEMLRELKAYPLLAGFRGGPSGDVEAACNAIAAFSNAAMALPPHVHELEINPLLVKHAGEGAVMLDALAVFNASGHEPEGAPNNAILT